MSYKYSPVRDGGRKGGREGWVGGGKVVPGDPEERDGVHVV